MEMEVNQVYTVGVSLGDGFFLPDVAAVLERVVEGSQDVLAVRQVLGLFQVLAHRFAGDSHGVAVNQLVLKQVLQHGCKQRPAVSVCACDWRCGLKRERNWECRRSCARAP